MCFLIQPLGWHKNIGDVVIKGFEYHQKRQAEEHELSIEDERIFSKTVEEDQDAVDDEVRTPAAIIGSKYKT